MNRTESAQAAPVSLARNIPAELWITLPQPLSACEISLDVLGGKLKDTPLEISGLGTAPLADLRTQFDGAPFDLGPMAPLTTTPYCL